MATKSHDNQVQHSDEAHEHCYPHASRKDSNQGSSASQEPIYFLPIPSRESPIRRRISTNYQPEALKQICRRVVLQDGGSPGSPFVDTTKRLYDETRSQGRVVLFDPNPPRPSQIPTLCVQREDIRVPMSPLRSEISPSCFHQANDSNYSPYQEFGNTDCHFSRRHSHPTSISQRSTVYFQEDCDSPRAFRIPHQPEQMFATPFPATYLPGNIAQHGHNVSHPTGSTPATYQRQRYTTGVSYTPGTHKPCSSEWHLAGPSALPSSSEGSFSWNSKIGLQEFEAVPRPVTGGYERPGMVAVPGTPGHQCSTPQMLTIRSGHSHRCIPIGQGATADNTSTGSRWSPEKSQQHINVLELKAAYLTVQAFTRNQKPPPAHIHLRMDNTTAVAYLNKRGGGGGTRSPSLSVIALELWSLVLKIGSWVIVTHIPGILNVNADTASRQFNPRVEWTLDPSIFRKILDRFYLPEVDLFASRLSHQVERYISRYPDPGAIAVDAFLKDWRKWNTGRKNEFASNLPGANMKFAKLCNQCKGGNGRIYTKTGKFGHCHLCTGCKALQISYLQHICTRQIWGKFNFSSCGRVSFIPL